MENFFGLLSFLQTSSANNKDLIIIIIIGTLSAKFILKFFCQLKFSKKLYYKFFTIKRNFISIEDYNTQANVFTSKQLKELNSYIHSPHFNVLKFIPRLRRLEQ